MSTARIPDGTPLGLVQVGLPASGHQSTPGRSDPPVKPTSEVAHQPGQQPAALFDLGPDDVADTSDDWYTPLWLFQEAGLTFDMDVCAPVNRARRTCPARTYLTPLEDGLTHPWSGLIWMNPPYSKSLPWIERFAGHSGGGLALLPATRSAATQALFACADRVTFFTGQFSRPNGAVDHNPWLLVLAARGVTAQRALERISTSRGVPSWLKV